jgi:hypothetical protein
VTRATTTISTTPVPASGKVGDVLNDTALVSGGSSPTGTVTFNLYAPSDATCSGVAAYTQTSPLISGAASTSPGFASNAAGTWHWTAVYSGDVNNAPATSSCQAEPVVITQPVGQYCSPGYWKQSQHFDSWKGVLPTAKFSTVFGVNPFDVGKNKKAASDPTLLEALNANGGGINLIAREAVDALLNAETLQFGYSVSDVISAVQQAINTNNPSLLDKFNLNENCPLN